MAGLSSVKRSFVFAAPLVLVAGLSACGGDDDGGASQSTFVIQPSTFTTQPLSQTTSAATTAPASGSNGGTVAGTQVYEVQSNDFLSGIAQEYDISAEDLANFNDWPEGIEHVIQPGDVINIPPGAAVPQADDEEDEDADSGDGDSDTTEEDAGTSGDEDDDEGPELCPDGDPQGTHEIQEGDIPGRVAAQYDVTLDQLNEANANTPRYSSFIVGDEILIPCGGESTDTEG